MPYIIMLYNGLYIASTWQRSLMAKNCFKIVVLLDEKTERKLQKASANPRNLENENPWCNNISV